MDPLRYLALRLEVLDCLHEFVLDLDGSNDLLAQLLGARHYDDIVQHPEKYATMLEALAGPNGYTVFKMLEARL